MGDRPHFLYDLASALMLGVALYAVVLLAISVRFRRGAGRDVELSHLFMGVAMAGMFTARLAFGPNLLWELIFSALAIWFVVRSIQSIQLFGPHVPHTSIHALMSMAMLLMYWFPATPGGAAMAMSSQPASASGARLDPGVGFVLALALFASAIFTLASPRKGGAVYGTHVALASVAGTPPALDPRPDGYLAESPSSVGGLEGLVSRPWLVDGGHVIMCVVMGFMLVLML